MSKSNGNFASNPFLFYSKVIIAGFVKKQNFFGHTIKKLNGTFILLDII